MASKRRASLFQRDFISLVFSDDALSSVLCLPVYSQLERDPTHISRLITNEELMLKLLSDFSRYATRTAQFFEIINRTDVSRAAHGARRKSCVGPGIADELVENVLFPLLGDDFAQFQLTPPFLKLFAAVIDFCLPLHVRPLEVLAQRLADKERLLGALVAGKESAGVMREWVDIFRTTISNNKVVPGWARRLVALCRRCESNHGVQEEIDTWQRLEVLVGRLASIVHDYPRETRRVPAVGGVLRRLTDSDKKAGVATREHESGLELPPDVKDALQGFGITQWNSERLLSQAIETLESTETLRVLQAVAASFPCRPCYELSISPSPVKSNDRFDTGDLGTIEPFLFTELLGPVVGIWRVLVSSQALKDIQDAHIQGDFNWVESKLTQLASGEWLRNSLCDPVKEDNNCILNLAPYGSGGRILWQVDIEFDEESDTTKQLVKIWRIGDLKMIPQAVRHILSIHKTYPPARLEACNQVPINKATEPKIPTAFDGDFSVTPGIVELEEITDGSSPETLFQFNKFYLVTKITIDNLRSGNTRGEYPLILSKEELEIIKDSATSTLVLGRSGTGKTTCLVNKLFGRYVLSNNPGIRRSRRQVLLTRSSVLSNKLELYTKRLIATRLSKGEPTTEDGEEPIHLIGQDDREVNDTVFSIKDEEFPLVCTFNHFMKILENTARAADRKDFSYAGRQYQTSAPERWNPSMGSHRAWQRLSRRPQVVDFEVFSEEYWPSFPSKLTKNISATLAFMEIIGVIKGSACCSLKFCPLSREEYKVDGHKVSPVSVNRDVLYDIYQHYEKQKRQFGDVDDIDRARSVLEAISDNAEFKKRIEGAFDEIYVDEIQDQRLLEIMMLLHLVKSPNAIHFAGDTAQSISKDSVFRFHSVKDLLFQRFSLDNVTIPQLRGLYKNYRTHQGILSVATCVMRQLYGCFPRLVDRLSDEVGQFSGPKPTVFVGFDAKIFSSRMFGAADLDDDGAQFGAGQVIIVRDFAEKKRLKEAIGDFALILTIMESKGMEFEDVLLYNFFTTCECISDFRVLSNLQGFAGFDGAKHIALCSELKQLYVAITRAQNRLWFFERNGLNLAPMLKVWRASESLVEVVYKSDINIQKKLARLRPGSNTNPEIWSTKGYDFIHKKDYENALFCFGRAKDQQGKSLAHAFIAEKKGKALLARGDEDRSEECFRNAIDLFHKCGHPLREAACYEALGKFEKAAVIFSDNGEFGRAADLFNKIDSFENAARNYSRAQRYNEGASTLARGNLFDNLVRYLNTYGQLLDSSCHLHYSRLCNLLLKRGKISPELQDLTVAALRSDAEKEDFFREYEMTSHLYTFYTDRQRYTDACNLTIKDGDLDKAWELSKKYGGMEKLPLQKRIDVFNYSQAKHLLADLATDPSQLFLSDAPLSAECSWLSDSPSIPDFWINLKQNVNDLWRQRISYKSIDFASTWMKQIFDTIVVFKSYTFISSARTVSELPIESINEVLRMSREMIAAGTIPPSLLILLRVFPIGQDVKSYTILESSPLRAKLDTAPLDATSTSRAITRWILSQVCRAIDQFHDKALEIYNYEDPCVSVLSGGKLIVSINTCRRTSARCRNYHSQVTSEQYSTYMSDVLSINSVFCHLMPIYQKRFGELGPEGVCEKFRPRQRRWLECLLARITYVSSLENEPGMIANTKREICQVNSPHFGLSGELETLLHLRLKTPKDWEQMCDFSSMLEQLQVAETLGVLRAFRRILGPRAKRGSEQSRKTWKALQSIQRSLWSSISERSVQEIDAVIQAVECNELCSYHSVATLYEKLATYLICKSHPTDFLLPNGWVEMYLRQMPELLTQKVDGAPQGPKTVYREALLSLIQSFCSLIKKMNSNAGFNHKLSSGRQRFRGLGLAVFVRRNVDFLLTCVLNAASWQTIRGIQGLTSVLYPKYVKMRNTVSQVLGSAFAHAPELLSCPTDYVLARMFVKLFNSYAGKDSICLIKSSRSTPSFFLFLDTSVSTILIESLRSPENVQPPDTSEATPSVDVEAADYRQTVPAAEVIQRMWRTRYPVVQKRREFFNSPSGQGILYMQRICKKVVEGELLSRKEKRWRTGVLFSDGLDVYLRVKAIEKMSFEKKKEVKMRIDSAELSLIESFQYQWERVLAIRDRVSQSAGFLSEKNWQDLDIPAQDLVTKFQEVMTALGGIELDLYMVDRSEREVAAARAIQQLWRTCYPILQKRREFFQTPSGKAITYIRKIYRAILEETPIDPKERIKRAAVLYTEGLEIYERVKTFENLYQKVKKTVKIDPGQARAQEKLLDVRQQVHKNAGFLSEKSWKELNIPSRELRDQCMKTLTFLKRIEADLNELLADGRFSV